MIKKEALFMVLIVILLTGNALGAGLNVTSEKTDSRVFPGSEVLFKVTIRNDQTREDIIRIDPDFFATEPFSDFIDEIKINPRSINIPSGEERNFDVTIKYANNIKPEKTYTTNLIIKSTLSGEVKAVHPLTSFIMSSGDIITMKSYINDDVIPGKEVFFDVEFKNNVNEEFNDLNLFITSGSFKKEERISIKGNDILIRDSVLY
ncbi:hypothetical protein HYX16_05910 [Candidatus Woesearchaeota archaeon]|nr:hypothetical protein [Candidatus Woesearchaeota archaeon]